jgi:hypothetical protein
VKNNTTRKLQDFWAVIFSVRYILYLKKFARVKQLIAFRRKNTALSAVKGLLDQTTQKV